LNINEVEESKSNDSGFAKAQHFDVQEKNVEPNTDVEISTGSMGDGFQTDSLPKDSH
jgi:hypothetical protein